MSGTLRTHAARALVNRAALHLLSEDDALPFALAIEEQMARLAPQRETLDVDRLARALKVCDTRRTVEWNAPRVAAEYARLAAAEQVAGSEQGEHQSSGWREMAKRLHETGDDEPYTEYGEQG